MSNIKEQLHSKCAEIASRKVNELTTIIQEAQEAANNETKSSAGDKHETGRAMAQLETEKLTAQLAEALKLEQVLNLINPNLDHNQVALGSLVITNNGSFYIAVSLGKIEIDTQLIFAISSVSPIGKQLIGLKVGDEFTFIEKNYSIIEIV